MNLMQILDERQTKAEEALKNLPNDAIVGRTYLTTEIEVTKQFRGLLDEAAATAPKHYVYTDYSHYYIEDFENIPHGDYPKYVHIPDDEEWLAWFGTVFGGGAGPAKPSLEKREET